jgi:Zn-dependent peptidase ImmA (M78 family)
MMGQSSDDGQHEAHRLITKFGITEPPVPVESIVQNEGIEIARHRFEGPESGFAIQDGFRRIIGVNTQTSRRRQRFTLAHELGHILLHAPRKLTVDQAVLRVDLRNEVSSMGTNAEEIQANNFAASLLMPDDMVLAHVTDLVRANGDISRDDLISQLAREFDVSIEAMGYRLINLGILTA